MIENIRKYTGLMIVVLVLLFIGLVFLGDSTRNTLSGKPIMEVDGIGISNKEFQRLAVNALEIPAAIGNSRFLPRSSRIIASHYIGEEIINNEQVVAGAILRDMTIFLQADNPGRFLANRLAVRKAGLEYGATPGPDEVEIFVENVLFADDSGKFDQAAFSEFMEKKIGRLGIGSRGFNEYVRDLLTAQNLAKILGGGIAADTSAATALFSLEKQAITAEQVTLDMLDFEKGLAPTEEEIKAHYEENKAKYNSDEERKATYVFIEPNWEEAYATQEKEKEEAKKAEEAAKKKAADAEAAKKADETTPVPVKPAETPAVPAETPTPVTPAETPTPQETPEETSPSPAEEGAQGDPGAQGEPAPAAPEKEEAPALPTTEEAPAPEAIEPPKPPVVTEPKVETPAKPDLTAPVPNALETKPAPAPVVPAEKEPKDKLSFQNKEAAVKSIANKVDDLYQVLLDDKGKNFEKHVTDSGFTVKTTEFFTQLEPAKELDLRASDSSIGKLSDIIYSRPADGDPDEKMSDPFRTNEGWFIGRLDEVIPSAPLSYEEAKVKVTVDLKKKIAREKMIARAKELHEQLAASVKEGKTFEEAAKAIDEKLEVSKLPNLAMPDLSGIPAQYRAQFGQAPPAFEVAQFTNPGEIAEIKYTPSEENPEKALIVFVDKREITVNDAYTTQLKGTVDGQAGLARYLTFQNWLYEQYELNQVVPPKTEQ